MLILQIPQDLILIFVAPIVPVLKGSGETGPEPYALNFKP